MCTSLPIKANGGIGFISEPFESLAFKNYSAKALESFVHIMEVYCTGGKEFDKWNLNL